MKNFFVSFLGSLLAIVVSFVLFIVVLVSVFSPDDKEAKKLRPGSVLALEFNDPITDRSSNDPFARLNFTAMGKEGMGLDRILKKIELAKTDTAIKGIYLNLGELKAGVASVEEIRNALLDFKKDSKKFVYAYSEVYSQKSYYLASVADKIYLNPQGAMELKGLSAQIMFYKNALEKLNVEVQIFRHGKFKSAIEPFMLDKMSEANRLQTEVFMNSIWNSMLTGISKQRGISAGELNKMADELSVKTPEDAVTFKLVDQLAYQDEVCDLMKKLTRTDADEKLHLMKLDDYRKKEVENAEEKAENAGKKIAVIYAVGSIESGEGDDNTIGSDRIARAISEVRMDPSVKAIVLRVNSPGGSALASDVMWREAILAKKVKPFIVSMGDVAASGGYYISCAADKIFAQPNTITGSIGVFGMMPNAQRLLSEKLGITIDTVNTNKHSDIGTIYRPVTESEKTYIQKGVEDVYDVFTKRVAEGRKMTQADVDSIGQGRVWAGSDALKIKLVDELGGLDDAIAYAAKIAKVDNYTTVAYPKRKSALDELLGKAEDNVEEKAMVKNLGEMYSYVKYLKTLLNMKGVQARLPFEYVIY